MNTKFLMVSSSLTFGLTGIVLLFAPDLALSIFGSVYAGTISLLMQLMGTLYFSIALMNWTAKDGMIGGIYARPVSLANFGHFFAGALLLVKYQFTHTFSLYVFTAMVIYVIFAGCFYWLVFRATGLKPQ